MNIHRVAGFLLVLLAQLSSGLPAQGKVSGCSEVIRDWTSEFALLHSDWQVLERGNGDYLALGPGIPVCESNPTHVRVARASRLWATMLCSRAGLVASSVEALPLRRGSGMWYAHFRQVHRGLPVEDAALSLRIDDDGRLVSWRARLFELSALQIEERWSEFEAKATALRHLEGNDLELSPRGIESMTVRGFLHHSGDAGHVAAWRVDVADPVTRVSRGLIVSMATGEILDEQDLLIACNERGEETTAAVISGVVRGTTHEGQSPSRPPVTTLLRDVDVVIAGVTVTSGAMGQYSFAGGGATVSVTSDLSGPFVVLQDAAAPLPSFSATVGSGPLDVVFDDSNSTVEQRSVVHFINKTHAHIKARLPGFVALDGAITASLNVFPSGLPPTPCGAFYIPGIHEIVFAPPGNCFPLSTIGTVVAHEYGHAFTAMAYGNVAAAFSTPIFEGLADVTAAFSENDPSIGGGYLGPGTEFRNIATDSSIYPGNSSSPHARGLVLAGAIWDLRTDLSATLGSQARIAFETDFYSHQLAMPRDEVDSLLELLLLDDNDGNLLNGTPNIGLFYKHFALRHGIPFPGAIDEISHQPVVNTSDQQQGYTIHADVNLVAGLTPVTVAIRWRLGSAGVVQTASMTPAGNGVTWIGTIPTQPAGTIVEYKIEVTDDESLLHRAPRFVIDGNFPTFSVDGGFFSFVARNDVVFHHSDFETPAGWTSNASPGSQDDWQRGAPGAAIHPWDPPSAFSGTSIWRTDSASTGDGRHSTPVECFLVSPAISCSGRSGVHLQYRRWLTCGQSAWGTIDVSTNNGSSWTEVWRSFDAFAVAFVDREWVAHRVNISSLADGQPSVRLRFRMASSSNIIAFGGWNVDDLRLVEDGGPILQGTGTARPGSIWTLDAFAPPGDTMFVFGDVVTNGVAFPGLGSLTVDPFSPSAILLAPGLGVPASGQLTWSAVIPPASGWSAAFQALRVSPPSSSGVQTSQVVTLTIP